MRAITFVQALQESGRVRVSADAQPPEQLSEAVLELDRIARPQLAFDPPALTPAAGEWALLILYRACQALAHREIEGDAMRRVLSLPCPQKPSPEVCYSADLALRFLPDLLVLSRGVAEEDPLVAGLMSICAAWPLSSVGVKGLKDLDIRPFFAHASLRRLYADRIIEKGDLSRTGDPTVREAVREALGAYPALAPRIAEALNEEMPACP